MTRTLSAICAMVSSWVIITNVCPYSFTQDFKREMTSNSVLESRFPVGSVKLVFKSKPTNHRVSSVTKCPKAEKGDKKGII